VLYYLVEWCPTLVPKHLLGHAKELMDEFEARLRAQRGVKNRRGGSGLEQGDQTAVETDASGSQPQKRPRGRPRKQSEAGYRAMSRIRNHLAGSLKPAGFKLRGLIPHLFLRLFQLPDYH
jgi:hypothetical protein